MVEFARLLNEEIDGVPAFTPEEKREMWKKEYNIESEGYYA